MWNYYGKNDGYCIGLNFSEVMNTLVHHSYSPIHGSIIYDSDEQIRILESELQYAYDFWKQNHEGNENMLLTIVDTLFIRWATYTLFFKHSGYQQEEEYRIVFPHEGKFDVKYRTGHGVFTPYIAVPTTKSERDKFPLESIAMGPLIKHDRAQKGLAEWLRKNGNRFEGPNQAIFESSIPLRF